MFDTQSFHSYQTHTGHIQTPKMPVIKVLGLGGGGSNTVDRMFQLGIPDIEYIAANTDRQALRRSVVPNKILLGPQYCRGLGAGGNPTVGEQAARESADQIKHALQGADMIFIACGMGGGTGTGSIPVAAEIAKATGALTIAIVTTPFSFEGTNRSRNAQAGIAKLRERCNTLITVPNDKLLECVPRNTTMEVAFRYSDEVLRQGVQSIAEIVTRTGLINVDFANVKSLMELSGGAVLTIGVGRGENKAVDAVQRALSNPLLDIGSIDQAAGVLMHFTGGDEMGLLEIAQAVDIVQKQLSKDALVTIGATVEPKLKDKVQLILVATGLGGTSLQETMSAVSQPVEAKSQSTLSNLNKPSMSEREEMAENIENDSIYEGSQPTPIAVRRPEYGWVNATTNSNTLGGRNLDLPAFLRKRQYSQTQ